MLKQLVVLLGYEFLTLLSRVKLRAAVHGKNFELSGTAHAEFICAGEASAMFMKPPQTLVGDPSPRQTSCGKNSDCVMNPQRSSLVRGSDPP